jgi:hypothetical protein
MPEETKIDVGTAVSSGVVPDAPSTASTLTTTVPASKVIGLDPGETVKGALKAADDRMKAQQPKRTVDIPRDEVGRFTKPAAKPAAPAAKPAEPKPAEPATPAAPTAKPAEPEPPKKIKIGGKEYTPEELEKLLEPKPAAPAAPAPKAPEPAKETAAPKADAPSPEQIAEAESRFVNDVAARMPVTVADTQLEGILVGGKEGAEALTKLLQSTTARAILEARKSIFEDLNPHLAQIHERIQPILQESEALQVTATEQLFLSKYPEYQDFLDDARLVAKTLVQQYPKEVQAMSREQFVAEVERQLDRIKQAEFQRWKQPTFTGTWKDWHKASKAAPATPTPAAPEAPAATPPATPTPAAAPAAPAKPTVRPPAANSPGTLVGGKTLDWQKSTARSLQD